MSKLLLTSLLLFIFSQEAVCQVDTIKGPAADKLVKEITKKAIDTTLFLAESAREACLCIDSIKLAGKSGNDVSKEIAKCIDASTASYQLALLVYKSMTTDQKNINYSDKNTEEYKQFYFRIESWLRDSCKSLGKAVASENAESEVSFSKNENAMAAYQSGVDALNKDNFTLAAEYFATAVALDPQFAFAWDNLGICNRRIGKYDEALNAYKKSLAIDPRGKLPLQNIPIVYEYKKDYDNALQAYLNILTVYPGDPEAFYGAGRIYASFKLDYEKALQNMCKAYNIYTKSNSPYRVDAEKNINYIYGKLKEAGKEKRFYEILEENNIKAR